LIWKDVCGTKVAEAATTLHDGVNTTFTWHASYCNLLLVHTLHFVGQVVIALLF